MSDKRVEVALILSAYDKVSAVVNSVVSKTSAKLAAMQAYTKKLGDSSSSYGRESLMSGTKMAAPLVGAAKLYADQEESMLRMKAAMMQDGNVINQKAYNDLVGFANKTSEQLTGSVDDYLKMIRVLQENSIRPDEILGGIGDSVAKLSVFFKMAPDSIAQFAARMKQDMGIMPKEMGGMMDFVARLNNAGVGKNGEEAVLEMSEAFSKAGLGAQNLGVKGLQASKDLGALMGIFIRRGISGQTVGNNFRRIFDGLRDADKIKNANDVARQFGITLDLFDKDHKFRGIPYLVGELNKLKGLNVNQISAILKPFGGKQGLSTDFLEFLGKEGTESFNTVNQRLSDQATLGKKVTIIMSGLANQFNRTKTTAINVAATFASTYAPEIKNLLSNLNVFLSKLNSFITTHKTLVSNIAKGIAFLAAYRITVGAAAIGLGMLMKTASDLITVMGLLGKIMLFAGRGILIAGSFIGRMGLLLLTRGIPAMVSFTATVWANAAAWLANPATYIILAIIAAVAALIAIGILVYKNWDKILRWFKIGWAILKASVAANIAVFQLFWQILKGIGTSIVGIFTFNPAKIAEGAKEAAAAINSIMNGGIKKVAIEATAKSLRESGIDPTKSLSQAFNNTKKTIAKSSSGKQSNAVTNHYNINLHGVKTDNPKAFADQFAKAMKDHQRNQTRTSYK